MCIKLQLSVKLIEAHLPIEFEQKYKAALEERRP